MKISKRDRDINFYTSLNERENPDKIKARRSSNVVFLVCAMMLGSVLVVYALAWSENLKLEGDIKSNTEYIQDEANMKQYAEKLAIQAKAKKIEDYNNASAQYLKQLEESARFSEEWVDFYSNEMEKAIGTESVITSYSYSGNRLNLRCETDDEKNPKLFAQHLSELKKKDGTALFSNVEYTGFSKSGGTGDNSIYAYNLNLLLWSAEDAAVQETEQAAAGNQE